MKNKKIYCIVLFVAAIAAINIPVIAQPSNTHLDSLKRVFSYEVCRQYLNLFDNNKIISENPEITGELFAIVKIFPNYYTYTNNDNQPILPKYKFNNMISGVLLTNRNNYVYRNIRTRSPFIPIEYYWGNPIYTKPAVSTLYTIMEKIYQPVDSVINSIYQMLMSNQEYAETVDLIKKKKLNMTQGRFLLGEIELKIREKKHGPIKYTIAESKNKNITGAIKTEPRYAGQGLENDVDRYTNQQITAHDMRESRYKREKTTYMDDYIRFLKQANLAALRVILDDHIRRGVPIDISWIPEQTLAEIEATKPVRQLKKQIKALEKQQKQ